MIASMIATLNDDDALALVSAIDQLMQRAEIELGPRFGNRLPLAIETSDAEEMEGITRWIQELKGVLFVDIVFSSVESYRAGL